MYELSGKKRHNKNAIPAGFDLTPYGFRRDDPPKPPKPAYKGARKRRVKKK